MAKYVLADGDAAATFLAGFNNNSDYAYASIAMSGRPFRRTVTLTSAAAATPVNIVTAAEVAALEKVYVTSILLNVNGATPWTDATATIVTIQDTAASPVVGATFAKAQLTANAALGMLSAGCTLAAPILTGVGFTADKGLDIAADGNFAGGSNIVVTVCGFVA